MKTPIDKASHAKSFEEQLLSTSVKVENELNPIFQEMQDNVLKDIVASYDGDKIEKAAPSEKKISATLDKSTEALLAKLKAMNTETVKNSMASTFKSVSEPVSPERLDALVKQNMTKNINTWAANSADSVVKTMSSKVDTIMQNAYDNKTPLDEVTKQIQDTFTGTSREGLTQATTIARTESARAINAGKMEAYKEANVTKKEWIASGKADGRPDHMRFDAMGPQDMKYVYHSSHGSISYPGDPSASVSDLVNCRCTLIGTKEE